MPSLWHWNFTKLFISSWWIYQNVTNLCDMISFKLLYVIHWGMSLLCAEFAEFLTNLRLWMNGIWMHTTVYHSFSNRLLWWKFWKFSWVKVKVFFNWYCLYCDMWLLEIYFSYTCNMQDVKIGLLWKFLNFGFLASCWPRSNLGLPCHWNLCGIQGWIDQVLS